jgi:DNA-binding response OmpR family regulator
MPDMDGYELTRRVRYGTVARHKNVAILVLTSAFTEENLRHARTHRIDSLVAKPPSVDVLRLEIEAALKHAEARVAALDAR